MSDKLPQALYFPETMLQDIQDQATRLDRSLSWCAQYAWRRQRARFVDGPIPDMFDKLPYDGDKCKQTLYFPEDMLVEIQNEAVRLDHSLSWLIQRAWHWTRDEIAQMPDARNSFA